MGVLQRSLRLLAARAGLRIAGQALVSLAVVALLLHMVRGANLAASFRALEPSALILTGALQLLAMGLNSWRWQVLLRRTGIRECFSNLAALYMIGQFFSLFLPTCAGGDAVRVYELARRHGRPAQTLLATLQDRLLGLGVGLLVGLAATVYFFPLLPPSLRASMLLLQIGGMLATGVLLYPEMMIARVQRLFSRYHWLQRLASQPLVARLTTTVLPLRRQPPITLRQMLFLVGLAAVSATISIGSFAVLGRAMDLQTSSFAMFCLVVPMVGLVRMLPVSLNGIGVGEGAMVFLLGLFAVPKEQALALALAVLGLQTALALLGGVVLLWRMAHGLWARVPIGSRDLRPLNIECRTSNVQS